MLRTTTLSNAPLPLTASLLIALAGASLFAVAAAADVVATLVLFACSVALDNSSCYDPYWSVAPLIIALYWVSAEHVLRVVTVLVLLCLWAARLNDMFLGTSDDEARAMKAARTEAEGIFGMHVYQAGGVTPEVKAWIEQTKSIRMQEEIGASMIRQETDLYANKGLNQLVDDIFTRLGTLIRDGFTHLAKDLAPDWMVN